jgi:hypothetical protein
MDDGQGLVRFGVQVMEAGVIRGASGIGLELLDVAPQDPDLLGDGAGGGLQGLGLGLEAGELSPRLVEGREKDHHQAHGRRDGDGPRGGELRPHRASYARVPA